MGNALIIDGILRSRDEIVRSGGEEGGGEVMWGIHSSLVSIALPQRGVFIHAFRDFSFSFNQ